MSNINGQIKPYTVRLIRQLQLRAAQAPQNPTNKTLPAIARTFSSHDMHEEDERFDTALLDLKLFINDYGADYLIRQFQQVYPTEYTQLRRCFIEHKPVAVLLQKKK